MRRAAVRFGRVGSVLLGGAALLAGLLVAPHVASTSDAAPAAAADKPRKAPAQERPNIVMILVDDMTLDDLANMPNVRSLLGAEGTTFARTLSPYPLCCPARATLLTGRYAHNHKVMGNTPPFGGFYAFRDKDTLPVWLKRAGYRTMMVGKYLNGYDDRRRYVPPGWSGWAGLSKRVYNYVSPQFNINGQLRDVDDVYATDYLTELGNNRIRTAAPSRQPFFLWMSYVAPHDGAPRTDNDPGLDIPSPYVAPEYQDSFEGVPQPRNPNFNEDDVSDKPASISGRPLVNSARAQELWQQRQESLQSVDQGVASLVAQLKAVGELGRTVIAFTSDNGYLIGEHRVEGKILPYEESVRVPLLIRGPGFPAGHRVRQQASLADLAPTFVRTSGARATASVDGVALQRLAARPRFLADRPIVVEAAPTPEQIEQGAPMDRKRRAYVGIRTADDKILIAYADGFREFYDMRDDPYQLRNRFDAPAEQESVEALTDMLRAMKNCRGRACLRVPAG